MLTNNTNESLHAVSHNRTAVVDSAAFCDSLSYLPEPKRG